jgi:hypothetical protein
MSASAAARAKRYRQRQRHQSVTAEAAPRHVRRHDRVTIAVTVCVTIAALALAAVSASFSIIGLTAIFYGVFWPIVGMGVAMELGKLSAVAWLGRASAPLGLKVVIVTLIGVLMAINSLGAYGFLARSHIGDIADVASRRQVQAAVVADFDKRIDQIDGAIDTTIKRGRTASALALAAQETARRNGLVDGRQRAAERLGALQTEAATDDGPIGYLAALSGADAGTLMRLFILLVAVLLDPLAVALLLAAATSRGRP